MTEAAEQIEKNIRKYKMVCINDAELSEERFLQKREEIQEVMEKALPLRSAFEKEEPA